MRLRVEVVASGVVLDTVIVDGDALTYDTGAAREMFAARIARFGVQQAVQQLRDWSNGYLRIRELPED